MTQDLPTRLWCTELFAWQSCSHKTDASYQTTELVKSGGQSSQPGSVVRNYSMELSQVMVLILCVAWRNNFIVLQWNLVIFKSNKGISLEVRIAMSANQNQATNTNFLWGRPKVPHVLARFRDSRRNYSFWVNNRKRCILAHQLGGLWICVLCLISCILLLRSASPQ